MELILNNQSTDPTDPMIRLAELASDAGKITTRHAFLNPDEAAVILLEIRLLRTELDQLQKILLRFGAEDENASA
jgi:hypothetical protein